MLENHPGIFDWYSGLPLVTTVEKFEAVKKGFPRGWVVMSRYQATTPGLLPEELQDYLARHYPSYPLDPEGSVLAFPWGALP
jgi:hypothetical protein